MLAPAVLTLKCTTISDLASFWSLGADNNPWWWREWIKIICYHEKYGSVTEDFSKATKKIWHEKTNV